MERELNQLFATGRDILKPMMAFQVNGGLPNAQNFQQSRATRAAFGAAGKALAITGSEMDNLGNSGGEIEKNAGEDAKKNGKLGGGGG